MPVERRGRVIAVELGPTGLYPGRSPKFQRKAAAFVRWHEPDDARVSSPDLREDISPEDLIRALVGMCYMHDQPGWQKSVLRLVDVFIDGLRNRRTTRGPKA